MCTVTNMRLTNAVFYIPTLFLLYSTAAAIHPKLTQREVRIRSLTAILHPILLPYYFLFYTDPGALFWSLALLRTTLHIIHRGGSTANIPVRSMVVLAALSVISIVYRQTNVIWCTFVHILLLLHQFLQNRVMEYCETDAVGAFQNDLV
uniref:Dol-P-Glc:Glc(2)Man(9)GlcNAc(2)-PP-Dol alpha-1,2-glucosyltransferase n=1 Tax=Lygus hesperus TaxID=30085 RepID=A0A0A9Z8G5_LYGHE